MWYFLHTYMTIIIKPLTGTSKALIYHSYIEAFSDYPLPLETGQEDTLRRWELLGLDHDLSYGAFLNGHLVAFVLNSAIQKNLYNFLTGVTQNYRGLHLIEMIYQKLEQEQHGFINIYLEVLKNNIPAFKLYQKLGFTPERELVSLKGRLSLTIPSLKNYTYEIRPLHYSEELVPLCLYKPAFENNSNLILKHKEQYELHELRKGKELMAYAIYHPQLMLIIELGSLGELKENFTQLFREMKLHQEELSLLNIDTRARELTSFFFECGLQLFAQQYEMKKSYGLLQAPR